MSAWGRGTQGLTRRRTIVDGLQVHARVSEEAAPTNASVVLVHGIGVASR